MCYFVACVLVFSVLPFTRGLTPNRVSVSNCNFGAADLIPSALFVMGIWLTLDATFFLQRRGEISQDGISRIQRRAPEDRRTQPRLRARTLQDSADRGQLKDRSGRFERTGENFDNGSSTATITRRRGVLRQLFCGERRQSQKKMLALYILLNSAWRSGAHRGVDCFCSGKCWEGGPASTRSTATAVTSWSNGGSGSGTTRRKKGSGKA